MQQLQAISDTVKQFYWTLLAQGLLFILLAILVVIYPAILFALVAITFFIVGLVLLAFSWKVYSFWKKLPGFLKK